MLPSVVLIQKKNFGFKAPRLRMIRMIRNGVTLIAMRIRVPAAGNDLGKKSLEAAVRLWWTEIHKKAFPLVFHSVTSDPFY